MASISSITLPGNSRYDLKDAKLKGIYSVKGTQNSETSQWTGNINVDSLTDGLSIAYYLPVGSSDNVTLNLTLADNTVTGPIDVYMTSTKRIGTEYSAGSIVYLTYYSAGSISINGNLSLAPRWIVSNDLKEKITNAEIDQLFGDVGTSGTIYSIMQGATSAAAGSEGLVPAPAAGDQVKFLRGDGIWVVPTNTTYNVMVGATSSAPGQVGLVPAPAAGDGKKFLRGDGSWILPIANMTTTQLGDILDATIGKELKDNVDGLAEEIASVIDFRKIRTITQGDLNTFNSSDKNGLYYLNNIKENFSNSPLAYGLLLTFTRPDATAPCWQIVFGKNYYFYRSYSGSPVSWGDWHELIYSVNNNAPTLAWETTSTIGTVGNTPLTVTMPANPNTNSTYSFTDKAPTLAWNTTSTIGVIGGAASANFTVKMPANPNVWTAFKGSTTAAAGTAGYVPAPASGAANRYFRCDGTWQVPPNTWTALKAPTSAANGTAGYAPAPSSSWFSQRTMVFLNGNGGWGWLDPALANNATTTASHYALDARMGKTLNDKINLIGTAYWGGWKSVSITASTWTKSASSISLPAGKFLIGIYGDNANGRNVLVRIDNASRNNAGVQYTASCPPVNNGANGRGSACGFFSVSAATTLYAWAWANAACSVNVQCWAIRLG